MTEYINLLLKFFFVYFVIVSSKIRRFFQKQSKYNLKCLSGKTAIVTGGNSGIGFNAALLLASRGCRVIIADCVNAEKSKEKIKEITGNSKILYKHLDLSSLRNVREFATEIESSEEKIDILIHNAAIAFSEKKTTEDGLNYVMQVDFFGCFLLTHLLLEPLKNAKFPQIIFTTSITMNTANLTIENLNPTDFELDATTIVDLYSNSKLCNAIAAVEFAKKLEKYGILVNSYDPIGVRTTLFDEPFRIISPFSIYTLLKEFGLRTAGETPLEAAETILHLVSNEDICKKTGGHYAICLPMYRPPIVFNECFAGELWRETERLVKLAPEERL